MFPIAILAGGLATRLNPLTLKIPKALIDINGEPFITHQLRLLASQGITEVVICAGYLGDMLKQKVGDGAGYGLQVRYSFDGERLLGTGGAIRKALPMLGEHFFVVYGDSYLPCDLMAVQRYFVENDCSSLMTVFHNCDRWDGSNVLFSNGHIVIYDKCQHTSEMEYIDYGLGIFASSVLKSFPPDNPFDLEQVYQQQLVAGALAGYEVQERFYEIGSPEGIIELRSYLAQGSKDEDGKSDRSVDAGNKMSFSQQYLLKAAQVLEKIDPKMIDRAVEILVSRREKGGRLFILGVGGSAANASHAVNDFRKLAGFEAYTPADNVSELTARVNDEGWESVFASWLRTSRLSSQDAVLIFSVGGGDRQRNVSSNLVKALEYAREVGAGIVGVVGRDGGYTLKVADACILIPTIEAQLVTPFTEAFQAMIWHLMVSHPRLKMASAKWESIK